MNPLSSILNVFKKKAPASIEANRQRLDGFDAFERGEQHYAAEPARAQEALVCFDLAIECGFEGADVYELRAWCLQKLHFDLDALDDFDKAISLKPEDSNLYYMRSISKSATGDFHGCVFDLRTAIHLSKMDSDLNRKRDIAAKEMGYTEGVTGYYKIALFRANLELELPAAVKERIVNRAKPRRS